MNKFVMKSVAVGVLLAGFGSSAMAATAFGTSVNKINGHKPFITAKGNVTDLDDKGRVKRGYILQTAKADGSKHQVGDKLVVGDSIILTYILADQDGDKDAATGSTAASTITFFYKQATGWVAAGDASVTKSVETGKTVVTLKLGKEAAGATAIGMKVKEATRYGLPTGDVWYETDNIFGKGNLNVAENGGENGSTTEPGEPNGNGNGENGDGNIDNTPGAGEGNIDTDVTPPTGGDNSGGKPCDPNEPNCGAIVNPDATTIAIYGFNADNTTVNTSVDYSSSADAYPMVGEKYKAVVLSEGKPVVAKSYQWSLTGDNKAAGGTTDLSANEFKLEATQEYTIGTNDKYDASYVAGAQGFTLKVTAEL